MARRPSLIKRRKEKKRASSKKIINKMLDAQFDLSTKNYSQFLSYFSQRYTTANERREGKSFVIDFMKKKKMPASQIQTYRTSSLNHNTSTMFAIAYAYNNDLELPDTSVPWLINKIAEVSRYQKSVVEKPNIQDRVSEARSNMIGEVWGMIDDQGSSLDLYRYLQGNGVKSGHVSALLTKLKENYNELEEALDGKDPQLREAYPHKAELKELVKIYERLVADCERYLGNIKASKPQKKKKEKSATDQTKKMIYLKQWPELKLVSIDPTQVVGAMDLWVYNVKYKTLAHYKSREASGFKVRGTTLANYDKDTSEQRALRKPEKTLDEVLKSTPSFLKKVMDGLTTRPSKPNGRINENTILLRAFK